MFTQLPFFFLLLAAASLLVSYKTIVQHAPALAVPWLSYRFVLLLLGGTWWMIFYDDWRQPTALLVFDYGMFVLVRRATISKSLGVVLTLAPLLLVKLDVTPFLSILGLSFVTFRALDALLMRVESETADVGEYFLYLFFPPALLAGPMYRWRTYRVDLSAAYGRLSLDWLLDGWELMLLGLVQKFAFAQIINVCVLQQVVDEDYSLRGIVLNAIGYSAYLYFDFAGYSNMAIGAARLFGFDLPRNFNNPIASANPPDFWRRWHISLSEWLRDVVFSPLYKFLITGGRLSGERVLAQNIAILITLFVMGTWNGLQARYICSGLMFGLYSMVYNRLIHAAQGSATLRVMLETRSARIAIRVVTLIFMILALYVFSGRSPIQ